MQREKGKTTRNAAVRNQNSPGKEVTFNSLRNSIHAVVNTIEGQIHCLNARNCDDLR